jgi:WD40 repeat protein
MTAASPDNLGTPEDRLANLLATYDEALAAGLVSAPESEGPGRIDPDSLDRLREDQQVVALLERVWPRHNAGPDTIAQTGSRATVALTPPPQLGRFRIVRELGRGGFGVVYLAADLLLHRQVALKVPRPEALFAPELRERFLREARAAAGLSHPNIVPVFDSGEVGALWYLVSAYCPGGNLAAYLRGRSQPLPVRAAAGIVVVLADAVHQAHARGILHRDLKPGNVLLECAPDAVPGADDLGAVLRLADFGLAKFLEQEGAPAEDTPRTGPARPGAPVQTGAGAVLGTPEYMAPEQAAGWTNLVGPATDVYGLGVLLYELLTGGPPFQGNDREDLLQRVVAEAPPSPRSLRRDVPRDLEAICLKCLGKNPAQRYATAAELAEDLRRFLVGEPTKARPAGAWQRAWKWARRRPAAALLLAVSAVAALGLLAGLAWHGVQVEQLNADLGVALERARQERARAEGQRGLARRTAYAAEIQLAGNLGEGGHLGLLGEVLHRQRPGPGEEDLRGFEWYYLWRRARGLVHLRGHRAGVHAVAFSPDGRLCGSGSEDGEVRVWDVATGLPHGGRHGLTVNVCSLAFSPDGRLLAAGGNDTQRGEVKVWDVASGRLLAERADPRALTESVAFAPDGRTLAVGRGASDRSGVLLLWDPEAGRERSVLRQTGLVTAVAFSPDGTSLAAAYHEQYPGGRPGFVLELWDPRAGRQKASWVARQWMIRTLAFSPDGKTLISCGRDGTVKFWDVPAGRERVTLRAPEGFEGLALSPDGQTLVTVAGGPSRQGVVRRWDVAAGRERAGLFEPGCEVAAVAFAPDGRTLALACSDHLVRLWQPDAEADAVVLAAHPKEAWSVAFAPDGRTLASSSDDHTVKLWDPATRQARATLPGHGALVSCVAFAPDGRLLASGGYDRKVRLWDARSGKLQATLSDHTNDVRCLAFAPDGQTLASAGKDGSIYRWDVSMGRSLPTLPGHADQVRALAFAPDGRTLASASHDRTVCLWDVIRGEKGLQLEHADEVWAVAFSPDGTTLATGDKAGLIRFWDPAAGKEVAVLWGHTDGVRSLAFAPDGKTVASGSADRTVRLWQVATGSELLALKGQADEVYSVAFSPDGKALAAAIHDGTVKLWLTAPGPDAAARE